MGLRHRKFNCVLEIGRHINKNVKPTRRSLHDFKASWKLPTNVETSNFELHADMITTPYYICSPHSADTLLATQYTRGVYKHTLRASSLLCF